METTDGPGQLSEIHQDVLVQLYFFSFCLQLNSKNSADELLLLHSDDIIRLLDQNGRLLNKSAILF